MSHYFHLVAIRRHETSIYDNKIDDHSGYTRDNFVESLRNIKLSEVLLSDCPLHGGQLHDFQSLLISKYRAKEIARAAAA